MKTAFDAYSYYCMKIILIGNYPLDYQESMQRFATMLSEGFEANGLETEIWKPAVFFWWII